MYGRRLILVSLLLTFLTYQVESHSWIACTDYAEKNAGEWDAAKCRGFPRKAHIKVPKDGTFGLDQGYDHRPSQSNVCNVPHDSSSYTDDHPMAVYYPGQQVVLVHPMKNHAADAHCSSKWIPDTGSWILGVPSRGLNSQDPNLQTFRSNVIFNLGKSPSGDDYGDNTELSWNYPKPGYANAPLFCQNTDKALATYSFNVPRNLQPGLYTFVWLWAFNSRRDLYSTCFEVQVVQNRRERNQRLRNAGFTDLSEPCGGVTSNPNVMGNSNPGCTRPRVNPDRYAVVPSSGSVAAPPSGRTTTTTTPTTTTPQTTQSTTARRRQTTTTTTQQPVRGGSSFFEINSPLPMLSTQFSGEIPLPKAQPDVIRRYITVDLGCVPDIASFWNCQVISDTSDSRPTNHYELLQSGSLELGTAFIFYHVSFSEPCNLSRHPPSVLLTHEELE